jgi:hypothetical protein
MDSNSVQEAVRDSAKGQKDDLKAGEAVFLPVFRNRIPLRAIDYYNAGNLLMLESTVQYAHNRGT